jgi:beta-lactamase class A
VATQDKAQDLQAKYNFLAKRILVDNPNEAIVDFSPLKKQIGDYIAANGGEQQYSVFFEYLPTGVSIGFNEEQEIVGASLLKLPLAMHTYKLAEQGKVNFDEEFALEPDWLNSQYGELYKKGSGYKTTLRELVEVLLKDSDNTAALALYSKLGSVMDLEKNLLTFLDTDYQVNEDERIFIGAEDYSAMLKCLYFACYTNKDDSQAILSLMTQSKFDNRLKLYLPNDAVVAHKIGTFEQQAQSDCGIFYVENRNYLLCVMGLGGDKEVSRKIGDISQIVYKYITSIKQSEKASLFGIGSDS